MDECKFCKSLAQFKDDDEYYKGKRKNAADYTKKYTAALVSESYYKDEYTGSATFHGYDLNFCPVCGKSLKDET